MDLFLGQNNLKSPGTRIMVTPLKPKNPTDKYFSSKVPTYGAAGIDSSGRRRNKSAFAYRRGISAFTQTENRVYTPVRVFGVSPHPPKQINLNGRSLNRVTDIENVIESRERLIHTAPSRSNSRFDLLDINIITSEPPTTTTISKSVNTSPIKSMQSQKNLQLENSNKTTPNRPKTALSIKRPKTSPPATTTTTTAEETKKEGEGGEDNNNKNIKLPLTQPGPGQYEEDPSVIKEAPTRFVFPKESTHRTEFPRQTPGPGDYDTSLPIKENWSSGTGRFGDCKVERNVFPPHIGPAGYLDHDPVPQVKIYGIIPKTKRPPEYTWEKSFTPGPIYEYDVSDFNRNLNKGFTVPKTGRFDPTLSYTRPQTPITTSDLASGKLERCGMGTMNCKRHYCEKDVSKEYCSSMYEDYHINSPNHHTCKDNCKCYWCQVKYASDDEEEGLNPNQSKEEFWHYTFPENNPFPNAAIVH